MSVINLTPHGIQVFKAEQFVNLEQVNPTTWVADGVEGSPIATHKSQGMARIAVTTVDIYSPSLGGDIVESVYGDATGIPDDLERDDILIVSLPMQSMARSADLPSARQMVAPYKVVRSRQNGSLVLGCMGFTY